ncbi:hypothetical protein N7468_003645 [Penicillium chermesinum]|uniref:Uncharacterized protein n=1 Tax=Penicillium chermesinum TaxID=63820 RepID=A0A9W9P6T7_9EURO|nr:uncharacterized protein N7468_003645 [Penicillium chermesinum]KAJ5239026.1 hypothetical protein N7468_003645 [Penicillium chermesinum]
MTLQYRAEKLVALCPTETCKRRPWYCPQILSWLKRTIGHTGSTPLNRKLKRFEREDAIGRNTGPECDFTDRRIAIPSQVYSTPMDDVAMTIQDGA